MVNHSELCLAMVNHDWPCLSSWSRNKKWHDSIQKCQFVMALKPERSKFRSPNTQKMLKLGVGNEWHLDLLPDVNKKQSDDLKQPAQTKTAQQKQHSKDSTTKLTQQRKHNTHCATENARRGLCVCTWCGCDVIEDRAATCYCCINTNDSLPFKDEIGFSCKISFHLNKNGEIFVSQWHAWAIIEPTIVFQHQVADLSMVSAVMAIKSGNMFHVWWRILDG